MSTDSKIETSFWEWLGDGISSFSEGVGNFFLALFGSKNERDIRKLGYVRPAEPNAQHTVVPGSMLDVVNQGIHGFGRRLRGEQLAHLGIIGACVEPGDGKFLPGQY